MSESAFVPSKYNYEKLYFQHQRHREVFQDQHQHAATNCALSASNTPGVNTPHNKRLGLDPLHSEGRKAVFG